MKENLENTTYRRLCILHSILHCPMEPKYLMEMYVLRTSSANVFKFFKFYHISISWALLLFVELGKWFKILFMFSNILNFICKWRNRVIGLHDKSDFILFFRNQTREMAPSLYAKVSLMKFPLVVLILISNFTSIVKPNTSATYILNKHLQLVTSSSLQWVRSQKYWTAEIHNYIRYNPTKCMNWIFLQIEILF